MGRSTGKRREERERESTGKERLRSKDYREKGGKGEGGGRKNEKV